MEQLMIDAERAGQLADIPPRTMAVLLSAVINGLSIYVLLCPDRFGRDEPIAYLDFLGAFGPAEP
jgi:hypothetical protein